MYDARFTPLAKNAHVHEFTAMCWRAVSKIQKNVCVVILYYIIYSIFSFAITPDPPVTFVSDEFRVGDKYILMFLVASAKPVFTDSEGADVLAVRRCGSCFITNNKGFLPMTEYDAILIHGKKNLLSEAEAAMEPAKRYLIESTNKCIRDKFRGCLREPKITSFSSRKTYTLCTLCDRLIQQKRTPEP